MNPERIASPPHLPLALHASSGGKGAIERQTGPRNESENRGAAHAGAIPVTLDPPNIFERGLRRSPSASENQLRPASAGGGTGLLRSPRLGDAFWLFAGQGGCRTLAEVGIEENREADPQVARDLMLVDLYDDLRSSAARMLRRETEKLTLQPTELVNEVALRVLKLERMTWVDRQHFFATSARILRQAMMDAVRKRRSSKRQCPVLIAGVEGTEDLDVQELDEALSRLERAAPELAQIVELRFFVGLGVDEVAAVMGQSERTVKRRWQAARLWLAAELQGT